MLFRSVRCGDPQPDLEENTVAVCLITWMEPIAGQLFDVSANVLNKHTAPCPLPLLLLLLLLLLLQHLKDLRQGACMCLSTPLNSV